MSVQTTMLTNFALAIAGMTRGDGYQTQTREAAVAVQNGLFVCQGSRDETCKLPTSAAEVAKGLGIARANVVNDPTFGAASPGVAYQAGQSVECVFRGQVWVTVEEAVSPMDAVYVRFADGATYTQKGSFRKSADTVSSAATAAAVTGARYLTTASAGALALVDLNLPQ